ncbi:MAG: hypothetical protein M3Q33_02770 [Acidobacteriota bacterium]|nr:hypothetical protein [Acidobacteriota bacterium]
MLVKNLIRKSATFLTAIAVWSAFSLIAIAAPVETMGEINVNGQVTVNGQRAVSNSTIISGNTIVTGANSTATVNLGKNGRVELFPDTNFTLKFSNNSMIGTLNAGKVRILNSPGVATSVATRNATVVADAGQANTFGVDVGCADEARCTQTYVDTKVGLVSLRSGSTDKQVAAGADATFGNPSQVGCKPCLRGTSLKVPIAGYPWMPWILIPPLAILPPIAFYYDGTEPPCSINCEVSVSSKR